MGQVPLLAAVLPLPLPVAWQCCHGLRLAPAVHVLPVVSPLQARFCCSKMVDCPHPAHSPRACRLSSPPPLQVGEREGLPGQLAAGGALLRGAAARRQAQVPPAAGRCAAAAACPAWLACRWPAACLQQQHEVWRLWGTLWWWPAIHISIHLHQA